MSKKSIFFVILAVVLVVAGLAYAKFLQISALIDAGSKATEPASTISSTDVKSYRWESTLKALGSLEAAKGLEVTADISGRITNILFDAGSEVSAGDLLIEQDTSTEKAQLRSATSSATLAKSNLDRIAQLYRKKVASQSEYDNAKNAYQSALANADNIRASIEKKSIRAPFNGRLGIRLVNLGQTITAGTPVVSLQSTDQMFVNFFLPQQNLPQLSTGLSIRLRSDAVPNKTFKGVINAINPEIDVSTRSVEIQAILANPQGELLPGMFASLDVVLPNPRDVLIIPITAIKYATYGDSVFVVELKAPAQQEGESSEATKGPSSNESADQTSDEEANKALVSRQQFVRLGATRGDYVVVTKGLEEGQAIVSAGVFKLRNGGPVIVNNDVVPEFSIESSLDNR